MVRSIEQQLISWQQDEERKPLLISGLRQVGKTWSISDFGKRYFDDLLYINFDTEPQYGDLFRKTKDPKRLLNDFSVLFGKTIDPLRTLLFFDEIQECNEALNSLKYFCEAEEPYFVIGAGSYLGITLSKGYTFPVGKVEMIEMRPMSFKEFILNHEEDMLVEYIESIDSIEPIPEPIFQRLNGYLLEYYFVGGMPEAVNSWIKAKDPDRIDLLQRSIINAYYRDFSKYPPKDMIPKILEIWNSMVAQLSKENRKFKYSEIHKNARAREYEQSLYWLCSGNYLSRVNKVSAYQIPLKGYEMPNFFKLFLPDVGLLRNMADFPVSSLLEMKQQESIPFKGALVENYVLQELTTVFDRQIFYWAKHNYELDFLLQSHDRVLPIEVKAGKNVSSKSFSAVLDDLDMGVRFSMRNLSHDGKILNIPLVLVSEFQRLAGYCQ